MSGDPDEAAVRAMGELVEANARMAYAAYRNHRNYIDGDRLPEWEGLCPRKRERFYAVARANITFHAIVAAARS